LREDDSKPCYLVSFFNENGTGCGELLLL
jgi:hypothetical protein